MSVTKVIGDLDEAVRTYDDFEERTANDSLWGLVEIFDEGYRSVGFKRSTDEK